MIPSNLNIFFYLRNASYVITETGGKETGNSQI